MTKSPDTLDRSVIRSSVMPSAKYACAASPLMLSNGRTAIEGFPARMVRPSPCRDSSPRREGHSPIAATPRVATTIRSATPAAETKPAGRSSQRMGLPAARAGGCGTPSSLTENARMGSAMFLTACIPRSSNAAATRLLTAPRTASETMMPPGSASACRRAAMLTPSPYRSPSGFSMTSPRCTPMRKRILRSAGTSSDDCSSSRCAASAAVTAPAAVSNTASTESPAMLITRPWLDSISALNMPLAASSAATVMRSSISMRRE